MTLYEITGQIKTLLDMEITDEADGDAFAELYQSLDLDLTEKIDGCCRVVRNLESDEDSLSVEIKRLDVKRSAVRSKTDRLKSYIQAELEILGRQEVKAGIFTAKVRMNPEKVVGENMDSLPKELVRTTVIVEPIKAEIKKQLQSGVDLPGWSLVRTKSLQII